MLISGSGTNMAALLYASRAPECPYDVVLVASNNPDCAGLKLASAEGIATFALSHQGLARADHDGAMDAAIRASGAEWIALAGYMRILTPAFVDAWEGRMLNIHPSLLPLYKGLHTHERAVAARDSHGGCSVHLVTTQLDDGPVLGRIAVAILPGDTADTLAARVLIAEHQLYPRCLSALVERDFDPTWLVAQIRSRALAHPAAEETRSHGMTCFGVKGGKKFAYVSTNHHGDGRIALLIKISGADEQTMLIEQDDRHHYRPAYFGDDWIAIRLDLGDSDWDAIGDRLARSWRSVAPRKLTALMDVADQF